ncbi:MAG: hypothetical protein JAZ15_03625 [Candidatus Thiodiazotropha endolucinida]|nr:hypothetical protein [Candidatus Thiodiazotropha taylori]MCW4312086.1 hypothetical protein [Candidatus Thiodiazotropha taylori]
MTKKTIIIILSVVGTFYIAMWLYISFFIDCYTNQINTIRSPNGSLEVKYDQKICKSEPTEIKIWLGRVGSNSSSLIFSSIATTTEYIQLTWSSDSELLINYPEQLKPTHILNVPVNDVYIKYNRVYK